MLLEYQYILEFVQLRYLVIVFMFTFVFKLYPCKLPPINPLGQRKLKVKSLQPGSYGNTCEETFN